MIGNTTKEITYFKYCGKINTEKVLYAAKKKSEELGVNKVIIASEMDRSALKAIEVFRDTNIKIIVVTHYSATMCGPKGNIPIGLIRKELVHTTLKKL